MARVVERELGLVEAVHLQRDLIASQRPLLHELAQAAKYVRSLLPEPTDGAVRTRWRFEPSSQLGGDFFGYDWIDPDHFAVYLLDVSGHGVGAALLSVSVANALRGGRCRAPTSATRPRSWPGSTTPSRWTGMTRSTSRSGTGCSTGRGAG